MKAGDSGHAQNRPMSHGMQCSENKAGTQKRDTETKHIKWLYGVVLTFAIIKNIFVTFYKAHLSSDYQFYSIDNYVERQKRKYCLYCIFLVFMVFPRKEISGVLK